MDVIEETTEPIPVDAPQVTFDGDDMVISYDGEPALEGCGRWRFTVAPLPQHVLDDPAPIIEKRGDRPTFALMQAEREQLASGVYYATMTSVKGEQIIVLRMALSV